MFDELKDFVKTCNINVKLDTIEVKVIDEKGEDSGGVFRDCLTEFWKTFDQMYTDGCDSKIPIPLHVLQPENWQAIAKINVLGFKQEKYLWNNAYKQEKYLWNNAYSITL